MKPPFLRTPYNYDRENASDETALAKFDASKTQQHFKDEADINYLMQRYLVPEAIPRHSLPPLDEEIYNALTMQDALDTMVRAREAFMTLPAKVRADFGHDPAAFVEFTSKEENRDKMREMGLWSPEAIATWEKEAQAKAAELAALKRDAEAHRAAKPPEPPTPQKGTT